MRNNSRYNQILKIGIFFILLSCLQNVMAYEAKYSIAKQPLKSNKGIGTTAPLNLNASATECKKIKYTIKLKGDSFKQEDVTVCKGKNGWEVQEANMQGTGVASETKTLKLNIKMECKTADGIKIYKTDVYLKNPTTLENPIAPEVRRIYTDYGCVVPKNVVLAFDNLAKIAREKNVDFLEVLKYGLSNKDKNESDQIPENYIKYIKRANDISSSQLLELQECINFYGSRYGFEGVPKHGRYDDKTQKAVYWFTDRFCLNFNMLNLKNVLQECKIHVDSIKTFDEINTIAKNSKYPRSFRESTLKKEEVLLAKLRARIKSVYIESADEFWNSRSEEEIKLIKNRPSILFGSGCDRKLSRNQDWRP